jgi:hypothetical protein
MAKAEPIKDLGSEDAPLSLREKPMDLGELDLSAWLPAPAQASAALAPGATDALAALAIEVWRLKARLSRLGEALPAKELRPLESGTAKMEEALAGAGIQVDDPQGRPYHDGDPLEVLVFEPSPGLSRPTVLQTVKPAVLSFGKVHKRAEVVVGTPAKEEPKGGPA